MDEVKAMTQAGETVGRAVGTGLRSLRLGAVQVGQAGAEAAARAATAAEQRLADGADTVRDTVREAAADAQADIVKRSRKARKQLAKDARKATKQTGKDLSKTAKRARKHAGRAARDARGAASDLLATATRQQRKRGRKWPWLLGIGVVGAAAGAAYVLKGQQTSEPARDEERVEDLSSTNGTTPTQQRQPQVNHKN
jgi:hypothetical protein